MKNTFKLSTVAAALAVAGGVSLSSQAMAAVPLAGTNISNVATASYTDNTGAERVVTSNEVKTLVAQIGSFILDANREAQTTPNGQVTLSHILTNTGNGPDKFKIGLDSNYTDAIKPFTFDMDKVAVYLDRNKDGVADSNVKLLPNTEIELAAGESVGLVIVATTPSTATQGQLDQIKITATAVSTVLYGAPVKTNDDTVTITTGAVMQITKAANVSVTQAGKEIEYTLTFKNTGNASAKNVAIFDVLPAGVTYKSGSAQYSGAGLTDTSADSDNFEYNIAKRAFLLNILEVKANTIGTLKFIVTVNADTKAGDIKNTAYVDPDGKPTGPLDMTDVPKDPNTPPTPTDPTTVPSNPSIVTIEGTYDGSINDSKLDSFKDGGSLTVTGAVGDDVITLAGKQGLPVVFGKSSTEGDMVVVHNRGNTTDTYNLTIDKDAINGFGSLPTGSIVEILKADGSTPVTDTNGDGIVDTGPITAGGNSQFVVRVTLPTGEAIIAPGAAVKLVSTSVKNTQKDTLKLIISALTANSVDLVNRPIFKDPTSDKGIGVGTTTAIDSATTPPATPTTFDITIKNQGNIPDNYIITVPNVPTGWTVEVFEKDSAGKCTTAKAANSGNIKAGESQSFCLTVTPPAGTPAGTTEGIKVEIKSPSTGTSDDITFNVGVEEQRQLTFTPDRQGQVAPGGTIVYSHTLTNAGNVLEGVSTHYPLEIDWSSTLQGVNTSVYVDINNDGLMTSDELITGASAADRNTSLKDLLAKTGTAGLSQNESVTIFVKVEAPATATAGESDTAIVTFKPAASVEFPAFSDKKIYPNYKATATPPNVSITDRTVINLGQVRLLKTQALSADCTTAPTAYVTTDLKAKPGQCVYYRIVATNEGNVEAKNVTLTDMVPSYTTLVENSVTGVTKPKEVDRDFIERIKGVGVDVHYSVSFLKPASTATLEFAVKVDNQ